MYGTLKHVTPQTIMTILQSNPVKIRNYTDQDGNPAGGYAHGIGLCVAFQDGPRGKDAEGKLLPANGAFVEDLMVAAIARLGFFQESKFRHEANQKAIDHLYAALEALDSRAAERAARGVLGANVA